MSILHKRAIILDDEVRIRSMLEALVSSCGYTVTAYASPTEATIFKHPDICPAAAGHLELFDESPTCAELIIKDINMPTISGVEYVRKIRQAGCGVRHIAMMSGDWTEDALLEADALGCAVFTKPFDLKEMREWVSALEY